MIQCNLRREMLIKARVGGTVKVEFEWSAGFKMNAVWCAGFGFRRSLLGCFFSISLVVVLVCSAWSTSIYAQQAAKATIIIESVSNSRASRGKNLAVTYYQDLQCGRRGKSEKVFKKNYVKDLHRFNPLAVETDVPFIFQVSYLEKRRDETRACDAISSVELEPGRSYKAVFQVIDEVVGCNIRVFDVTDINQNQLAVVTGDDISTLAIASELQFLQVPVIDSQPESTCAKVGKKGYKSGTPVYSYKDRLG